MQVCRTNALTFDVEILDPDGNALPGGTQVPIIVTKDRAGAAPIAGTALATAQQNGTTPSLWRVAFTPAHWANLPGAPTKVYAQILSPNDPRVLELEVVTRLDTDL
jgi:hypothetical protein